MRKCQNCTSPISDDSIFCPICGKEQIVSKPVQIVNRFCCKCGSSLEATWTICPQCGATNSIEQTKENFNKAVPSIVNKVSIGIIISALAWIGVASYQLILSGIFGLCFIFLETSAEILFSTLLIGILGISNMIGSIFDFVYVYKIRKNFIGIVHRYRITFRVVIMIVYNLYVAFTGLGGESVLTILMGLLILAAIAVECIFVRLYILIKKDAFIQLERSQIQ